MARAPAVQDIEPLPEADRIEGFAHPRETSVLFGHEDAEAALRQAFDSGRMHHGWLITGPGGIGKATLAYRLARYAFAAPAQRSGPGLAVDEASPAARQVAALSHAGLLALRRPYDPKGKRHMSVVPVDEVRRLRAFLTHTAGDDVWRIVIVDTADDLNPAAANALLKSLEEPPPRTVFLLLSRDPAHLLPTIRSRCRVLALKPLDPEAFASALRAAQEAAGVDVLAGDAVARLHAASGGSVGRALALSAEKGLDLVDRVAAILAALPRIDWPAVHALADELGGASDARFAIFNELLLDGLGQIVRAAATGEGRPEHKTAAGRLIGKGRLASWAGLWETVLRDTAEGLALNLDRKALLLDTFLRIEAVTRGEPGAGAGPA